MAKSRYKFFDTVYNEEIAHTQKGLAAFDIKELFKSSNDILFTIPIDYQYRPDLIAKQFYGNPRLFWVLVYVNEINDSPQGFTEGRTIRIPRVERVLELV